jgi:DNA modification methylase
MNNYIKREHTDVKEGLRFHQIPDAVIDIMSTDEMINLFNKLESHAQVPDHAPKQTPEYEAYLQSEEYLEEYIQFLKSKIPQAEICGFKIEQSDIHTMLYPHQKDLVQWAIDGGRRLISASFGLGKTFIQLQIANIVNNKTNKPFLIGLPLGVRHEFTKDAAKLGLKIRYVRDMDEANQAIEDGIMIHMCNYTRIRMGKLEADMYGGCSFDEASILRSLGTETVNFMMDNFMSIPYRYVCTATPSPNSYTDLLNYAHFLGIMDRGQALTRFFGRNSTQAGDLTLYPHKEAEFWMWFKSWAIVIKKPSWLGYSDIGYDMPPSIVEWHKITVAPKTHVVDKKSNQILAFRNTTGSLIDSAKEKRESITERVDKMKEIIALNPNEHYILWHDLEREREAIEKALSCKSVYGKQDEDEQEQILNDFSEGRLQFLPAKPSMFGSGCNFQEHCYTAIYIGITDKFNDFIQSIHRILRFGQKQQVKIHIIYTDAEEPTRKRLEAKWARHIELDERMEDLVKTYGLFDATIKSELARTIGCERVERGGISYRAINNDNVIELINTPSNSVDLDVTSIPFGDQYEYSCSYHDMGHNFGNKEFFRQMEFLIPNMLRTLKPGRICAIHVKDRIRYSYQNGQGFTTMEDFSGDTIRAFERGGFWLMGKITVTTDVVSENNSTYRLGWSEKCKDGTKMGCGMPEYVLLFRKPPTDNSNGFADVPVLKSKNEYTRAMWQLDAHSYWRSDGNRLLNKDEIKQLDLSQMFKIWEKTKDVPYSYFKHLETCEALEDAGKLSATFMSLPVHSGNPFVWTDVSRMRTLNSNQANKKREKHICPLQLDIIHRLINYFSMEGEVVRDVFGGIGSVGYEALKMNRKAVIIELFTQYWGDAYKYLRDVESQKNVPTLF